MQIVDEWTYNDLKQMIDYLKRQEKGGRSGGCVTQTNPDGTITRRYTTVG